MLGAVSFLLVVTASLVAAGAADGASPVVGAPAGRVLGSWMTTRTGRRFEAYRGIRYAEPPVGPLRFQPPVLITRYAAAVDAREEGPACPQPAHSPGFVADEDCLRLNVYTPESNSSKLLPVIVYIHPGGFYSVTGRSDVSGPRHLLARDLVLVTINYRLGSLGFLATGDKWAPGNNGFKDQVAALRWVQQNIRAFGGDAGLVTVAGYSAGALSIGLHMLSPMAKGLFHRAIMMSASPLSQVAVGGEQRHLAERQARLLGCARTDDSERLVACLRTKPWQDFADSLPAMFEFGYDPILLWSAVVEPAAGQERYLPEPPLRALAAGRLHAVPLLIGQTKEEFFWKALNVLNNKTLYTAMSSDWERIAPVSFLLPPQGAATGSVSAAARALRAAYLRDAPLRNDSATAHALGDLYSDAVIGFAVHRMTRLMARHSPHAVFQYEFTYVGNNSHYTDPITKKPVAAVHHDELIYLLSVPAAFPEVPLGSADDRMVHTLVDIWHNFARFGDPNPPASASATPPSPSPSPSPAARVHWPPSPSPAARVHWPPYTASDRRYMRIDTELSVHDKLFEQRFRVWNELYPIDY